MIENIIFDLGDVLINLNHGLSKKNLQNFGLNEFPAEIIEMNYNYEKGLISTYDFIEYYSKIFPNKSEQNLVKAWNSIIGDFPLNRLIFLEELSKKFNLFLLSNTNDLHIEHFKKQVGDDFYRRFLNSFKEVYYSYNINNRKPEREAFQIIFKENNLDVNKTLFIDDQSDNTKVAQSLGLNTWNFNPDTEEVTDLFIIKKKLFNTK